MTDCVILIAEDDKDAIASWERDVKEFNRKEGQKVHLLPEFARSKRTAIRLLERTRINCAVVDLRLPDNDEATGHTEPVGNEILERLLLDVGVPAVVYSGYSQEASELVRASQIKIVDKKGGGAMEVLQWLADHESLMSAMEVARKSIDRETARLFTESIWPRWKTLWGNSDNGDALAGVITRQTAAHIAESLGIPPNYHHPEEFYLVPPLSTDRLGTGDLVFFENQLYVVVTPRCNLAREKYPKHIMLALCKGMETAWANLRNRFLGNEKQQEGAAKELHNFATQGHSTSTHFLPPCGDKGPWLVDFRQIITVPSESVQELLKTRFASLASQFVPNLVQRYAAYLGRIGQPDLDGSALRDLICK